MSLRSPVGRSLRLCALVVCTALPLVGCKQGEDLQKRIAHVQGQVDALKADLERQDALVEDVRALQIEEARFTQALFAPTVETIEAAFASLHGVRVVTGRADAIVVTGRAPLDAFTEKLLALGIAQPGLQLQVFNVDRDAVEVQLAAARAETPPGPPKERPLGAVFPWNAKDKDHLEALEKERETLRAKLPAFVLERETIRWRLNEARALLSDAHRSRIAMIAVARAFTPELGLEPVELEWSEGRVKLGGRPNAAFVFSRLQQKVPGLETFELTNVASTSDTWVTTIIIPPMELPALDAELQKAAQNGATSPTAEAIDAPTADAPMPAPKDEGPAQVTRDASP